METSRSSSKLTPKQSHDHEDHGSYSEDFEQDVESQDNSPRSEEKVQIRVFKTAIGALTIQPKKVFKTKSFTQQRSARTRTMSETSLCKNKKQPGTATRSKSKTGFGASVSVKINESKTSLVRLGTHCVRKQKPLAQEKVDPHEIPTVPASALSSTGSLSRISLHRTYSPYTRGALASSIRRVVAHTSINEKSYASAKYKAYVNPPLRGGNIQPPLRAGAAKQSTNTSQRVASAKRMTIMDLKSTIKLQQDEIEKLKKENRFLNHLHHRQDNALKKWEGKDAELPRLLNQHKDEIRSLQEQLRRAQHHAREHNEKIQGRDKKILRLEAELDKLKTLVHEEHLQDRHTLQTELDITRMNLVGAEKRIREYMRHVDILEKNHRHQLAAQEKKLIKQNTHAYELQSVVANLRLALRNKDRMLNYIQMRSSGRSLIRAYHAEKVGSGIGDEVLFGSSSLSNELSRPFHPPILKSHSFDFGNSRSETPTLEEKREYNFFLGKRHSDDHKVNYGKAQRSRTNKEDISRSRPVSRTSLSLESVIAPRIHTPFKKSESNVKKARSIAAPDKNKQQLQKSEAAKQHNHKSKSKPVKSILKPSHKTKDEIEIEESSDEEDEEKSESNEKSPVKKESPRKKEEKSTKKRDSKKKVKAVEEKESNKIKPVSSNTNALKVAESKEFIYRGSSTGFKYEGPFMKSSTEFPSPTKKESTEMLLSPKSENNSEHSLSYSHSTSSTKSEIISNIDMLSARIRDSCVRVPPPEEKKSKPASPPKGPGGDNNSTQLSPTLPPPSIMMANNVHQVIQPLQEINNNSTQYHQPGVLQQFQLFSADVSENNSSNSQQQFTITSPRIQVNPVSLQNVSSSPTTDPSTQFQLVQQNVGYMQNIEPHPQTCQQIHYSPRLAQAQTTYPAYNTVSVMADPQTLMGTVHQDQFHHPNNGYPVEFPYFSFTTQDSNSQPTSVTIIQTNPAYDQQISPNHSSNASIRSPSHFNTNQNQLKPSTLPPVGYFSPNPVKEREQTFPNPNGNSKANQSSYDPTFYSNLDTWK